MQPPFEINRSRKTLDRVLFIVYFLPHSVPTIESNIAFFQTHSKFRVFVLNLAEHRPDSGFLKIPPYINLNDYSAIIVHNTVSYDTRNLASLDALLEIKIKDYQGAKIILRQDEHYRFNAFAHYATNAGFDRIFTVMPKTEWPKTYGKLLAKATLYPMLTGYVLPHHRKPPDLRKHRSIDIGYRGSIMPLSFGRLCYNKRRIGEEVSARLKGTKLRLDISSAWEDRIGGERWGKFLSNCKAVLGVESGSGVFDIDGTLEDTCLKIQNELGPDDGSHAYANAYLSALSHIDGNIKYVAISPRHFEAIVAGAIQILLPGKFSGRLKPNRHFFELSPDYSNLNDAISLLTDDTKRNQMAECAFEEVILDKTNWIEQFVSDLDCAICDSMPTKKQSSNLAKQGPLKITAPYSGYNILVAEAHEYGGDPRRDHWYAHGAPNDTLFHKLSISDHDDKVEEKEGRVLLSIAKRRWDRDLLHSLFRELADDHLAVNVLYELHFLDSVSHLSDRSLFDIFGLPLGKEQIHLFRWYSEYLLDTAATILHALSNAHNLHGIIAINLPVLLPALVIGRQHNIPVFYEALEYWPEIDPNQPSALVHFWHNMEKRIAHFADHCGTVSPQLASMMTNAYGCNFSTTPNAVPLNHGRSVEPANAGSKSNAKVRFLFQGNYADQRSLDTLITLWSDAPAQAHLYLRGPRNNYQKKLELIAKNNGCLGKTIHFLPPVHVDYLIEAASHDADVGIIPYPAIGKNYTACSPNKMGQYLAAGLPLLANTTQFVEQTVNTAKAGIVVDFSQKNELLKAIKNLCNPELRAQFAANSFNYFQNTFHWEAVSSPLYDSISQKLSNSAATKSKVEFSVFAVESNNQPHYISPQIGKISYIRRAEPRALLLIRKFVISRRLSLIIYKAAINRYESLPASVKSSKLITYLRHQIRKK